MKGSAPSVQGKRKNPLRGIRNALRGQRTRGPSGRALLSITRPQRRGRSTLPSVSAKLKPVGNLLYPLGSNLMYRSEAPSNGGYTVPYKDYRGLTKSVKLKET